MVGVDVGRGPGGGPRVPPGRQPTAAATGAREAGGRRSSARRLGSALGLGGLVLAGGCGRGPSFGAPDPASREGQEIFDLWRGTAMAGLAVGAVVWAAIAACVILYRRRNDDLPSQSHQNFKVEVAYTVTPILVVAVLFGFTLATQREVTGLEPNPDLVVEVIGFQWSWEFRYPEQGVVVESDGIHPPRMVVPVGATVRFLLRTTDVNHSFFVPRFLVKRDLIQGLDNVIEVDVVEEGTYLGHCAEFCGLEHWAMTFDVAAVPPAEFDAWVAEQRARGPAPDDPGSR